MISPAPVALLLLVSLPPLLAAAMVPLPAPPPAGPLVTALVNRTARDLAARRGTRLDRPISVKVVDRAQLAAAVAALSDGGRPAEEARDRERLLARLGLAPDPDRAPGGAGGFQARGAEPALDVTGLYDPARAQLLVGDFADLATTRFTLTRDAAHAVLDQRFGLQRWLAAAAAAAQPARRGVAAAAPPTSDALWARQAVLEGDATVQALEHLDRYGRVPSRRALAAVAEGVRATIVAESEMAAGAAAERAAALDVGRRLFIYLEGLDLVAAVRARGPWSEVDALWTEPPASTEQVLHPDKYRRRERPDPVADRLPESLLGGWRAVCGDTLGELGARQFLALALDDDRAYRGAAGWGGDRTLLFQRAAIDEARGPERLAAWITTWDRDADAEDFAALAARVLAARAGAPPAAAALDEAGRLRLTDGAGQLHALERRGRTVAMVLGAPADADGALPELLGAATRRDPRRYRAR